VAALVLIVVTIMIGGMIWREERVIARERRHSQVEETFRRRLGDHVPATPKCDHKPVPVKLVVTGEVVRHLCSECLEEVPAPPIPPKGGGGRSSRTHDLTKTSAPLREEHLPPRARLIGGPMDGQQIGILGQAPRRVDIGRHRYDRLDDPDTGEYLGGYTFRAGGTVRPKRLNPGYG
jgi:hypothetical protein